MEALIEVFKIKHKKSTTYYPRCNKQAESTNKVLKSILTKMVNTETRSWDMHLPAALWAFRMAFKVTTRETPFRLAFGQEAIVPFEFMIPALRTSVQHNLDTQ